MSTKRFSVIGKGLPKIDSWSKVTGATQYADDLFLPRMAYGKLLRSPHPHALITRLDTSRAKEKFGFVARTSFEEGLRRTIAWYEQARRERS